MNIYIDESGSINNHSRYNRNFVISMINISDSERVKKAYKRFVSSNLVRLKELDQDKFNRDGELIRCGGNMFKGDSFKELKGSQFDCDMKKKFVEHFLKYGGFEVFYIEFDNSMLSDTLCQDITTAFNYPLKLALEFFLRRGMLPQENTNLQLDERNEKTNKKYFLEQYLNTELRAIGVTNKKFTVKYFDSSNNKFIQIADVFANLYYSQLRTGNYDKEIEKMKEANVLKYIFKFPSR